MLYGLLNLSLWGYFIATMILTQITIAAVTIYLHRHQSHRALELHAIPSHFFRFWLWLTTGMVTREWVAIHRKHHAYTEQEEDPHSPQVKGLRKVLLEGTELYREASHDQDMLDKYSYGTPDDWVEKNVYSRHSAKGILLMLGIDLLLFGVPGLTIWAIQMMWIPFFAAGVINGIGHYWGYRNFEVQDASRNIIPWGIFVGGEELHNNHHTFASSAKLSQKWWEIDLGWFYIRLLSFFGLATVKRVAPKLVTEPSKKVIDVETVKAVVGNRFQILANYTREVMLPVLQEEKTKAGEAGRKLFKHAGLLLKREGSLLSSRRRNRLSELLAKQDVVRLVYEYRNALQQIWEKAANSQKELLESLQNWCQSAEKSGVEALQRFAQQVRTYGIVSGTV